MTQTIQNYQETVNTLLFAQKAKNVKTTANINEISPCTGDSEHSAELEKARQTISDLQSKLKHYEGQKNADTEPETCPSQTTQFLQNKIEFQHNQIAQLQQELEERDRTIHNIMLEKREYGKKFDALEIENNQLHETIASMEAHKDELETTSRNLHLIVAAHNITRQTLSPKKHKHFIRTPAEDEHQSKRILEEDGIQPFDLERLQFDAQGDLRLSIEAQIKQMPPPPQALKQGKSSDHQEVKADSREAELLAQLETAR